jgi:hypothetical protein
MIICTAVKSPLIHTPSIVFLVYEPGSSGSLFTYVAYFFPKPSVCSWLNITLLVHSAHIHQFRDSFRRRFRCPLPYETTIARQVNRFGASSLLTSGTFCNDERWSSGTVGTKVRLYKYRLTSSCKIASWEAGQDVPCRKFIAVFIKARPVSP